MKHQTVGLQFDFQKSERAKPWKTALPIVGVPLLAAVLLLALKPARESLKCLCNLVFAASEAVNAYAYDYFEVSDAASPVLALGLLVTAAAGVLLLASLRGSKIVPLLAALALAGGEIWFGLTPPAAVNVLIFALLALLALPVDTLRGRLVFLLAVMAVFLTVQLLAPGVRMGVEKPLSMCGIGWMLPNSLFPAQTIRRSRNRPRPPVRKTGWIRKPPERCPEIRRIRRTISIFMNRNRKSAVPSASTI